jgi:hypothetical protein
VKSFIKRGEAHEDFEDRYYSVFFKRTRNLKNWMTFFGKLKQSNAHETPNSTDNLRIVEDIVLTDSNFNIRYAATTNNLFKDLKTDLKTFYYRS